MKFVDFYGRVKGIDISKYECVKENSRSSGAQKLLDYLLNILPRYKIYEEFPCVGIGLRLDFFVPFIKVAFEYDGRQHYKYNPFFHGSRAGFARSKLNDVNKKRWCEINNIELIRVNSDNMEKTLDEFCGRDE